MANDDYITPGDSMNGDDHSIDGREGGSSGPAHLHNSGGVNGSQNNDNNDDSGGGNNDNDNDNEEEDENQPPLFSCQCDSARTIATLLSCLRRVVTNASSGSSWHTSAISGGGHTQATQRGGNTQSTTAMTAVAGGSANKIQHATVYAGTNGLTFHVQHGLAKQSQCSVDMPKGLFKEYFVGEEEVWLEDSDVDDDEHDQGNNDNGNTTSQVGSQVGAGRTKEVIHGGEFGVNLTTVLECFSILSKNRDTMTKTSFASSGAGGGSGGSKSHIGEYASLSNVPLCMSYDRGTATFHLEFLDGGSLSNAGDNAAAAANMGGGCLVTCEVPGVAVADDVDDGPDEDMMSNHNTHASNNNSGLANAFRSSPLLSRAILYSDALQSAVSELYDVPGASIVQISLSAKGMELGTVGPRSEVWVNVPYHRGQGGMYVGLECYKPNVPLFGSIATSSKDGQIVRRYPLGAFLSGMRGLDIGVETCISVNTRGMMAIQHQISREGYYDFSEDGSRNSRPSFVDFIMTCIEDEEDDGDTVSQVSQDNTNVEMQMQHNGLHDITNNERPADDLEVGRRKTRDTVARSRGRGRAKAAPREESSSSEDEDKRPVRKAGQKGKKYDNDDAESDGDSGAGGASGNVDFGDEHEYQKADNDCATNKTSSKSSNNAASRILGELEMDKDMLSSRQRGAGATAMQGKTNALEDIRRRRREQRLHRQSLDYQRDDKMQKSDEDDNSDDADNDENRRRKSNDSSKSDSRKRRSNSSKAVSRKARRSEEDKEDDNDFNPSEDGDDAHGNSQTKHSNRHSNPAQDSQSQSQSEDDDGDETEHEDSLDVTAEIPLLFSKRSSLSTSRHGVSRRSSSRRSNNCSMDNSDEDEVEQEPRM
ncbi:hypothetical protein ACHAXR_006421, partial [Thalassiosira sp. AJA248-18]